MAAQIDKTLAKKIAKKLKAAMDDKKSKVHDYALVYHENVLVASFGIRRSSKKTKPHDHVPKELRVSPHFAKDLANCPKSRDDYLREIGAIEDEADP